MTGALHSDDENTVFFKAPEKDLILNKNVFLYNKYW